MHGEKASVFHGHLRDGVTMTHDYVSSVEDLKKLLEEHPEGIVAYDSNKPHAIALTDYDAETDTFYCSDPAECCAKAECRFQRRLFHWRMWMWSGM